MKNCWSLSTRNKIGLDKLMHEERMKTHRETHERRLKTDSDALRKTIEEEKAAEIDVI
jgi:hypothetical protein